MIISSLSIPLSVLVVSIFFVLPFNTFNRFVNLGRFIEEEENSSALTKACINYLRVAKSGAFERVVLLIAWDSKEVELPFWTRDSLKLGLGDYLGISS